MNTHKMKWWHCVIIYAVANAISFIPAGINGDEAFYNQFTQPTIAPPDWLFAPMWFILNVTSLIALYQVANRSAGKYRRSFIISETIGWILYSIFPLLYFGLKSPVLGALDTVLSLVVAGISLYLCTKAYKKSAWLIMLRGAWLLLATYVSLYIAMNNQDPLFN